MQPDQPPRFVFLDVEATGLDHGRHEMTEIAWIVRHEDGREEERHFFPFHTTDGADADALELTRYEERIAPRRRTPMSEWLPMFLRDADGAVIVGAVPDFDVRHLEKACRKFGVKPTWDHHLLDVETLALPLLATGPERPRSLARTCEALGVPFDRDQAHGALYDARLARGVFDRVWELLAALGADQPVIERVPSTSSGDAPADPPEPMFPAPAESDPRPEEPHDEAVDIAPAELAPVASADDPDTEATAAPQPGAFPPATESFDVELDDEPDIYEPALDTAAPDVLPLEPPPAAPEPDRAPQFTPAAEPGPIRPFDETPPDDVIDAATHAEAPTSDASDAPSAGQITVPLVEEAVTVIPAEGVEDALFGGRPRKVGHPGERDADPADE